MNPVKREGAGPGWAVGGPLPRDGARRGHESCNKLSGVRVLCVLCLLAFSFRRSRGPEGEPLIPISCLQGVRFFAKMAIYEDESMTTMSFSG